MNTQTTSAPRLIDPFGRRIDYIRLSVTDKCNLRCFYCIPKGFTDFETPDNWLSINEVERVIRAFAELGVGRVRLTGGEPLVRKDISELAARLSAIPELNDLSLSTNATLLGKHAQALKKSGVSRINVSLDTLRSDRFKDITCSGGLNDVLEGLAAASVAGLTPIKINMVAMKGVNDDEIEDMVEFCIEHQFTLRLIETMPMGQSGQSASEHYLNLDEVRRRLITRFNLVDSVMPGGGPARYLKIRNSNTHIGFITPISQHFCESCNRIRISAEGTIYLCMGQEHTFELRPLLRAGISDADLKHALIGALTLKPKQHDFTTQPDKIVRIMSKLGG